MNSCSIVNEVFDQALRHHPDLDVVNAQVSSLMSQVIYTQGWIEYMTCYIMVMIM